MVKNDHLCYRRSDYFLDNYVNKYLFFLKVRKKVTRCLKIKCNPRGSFLVKIFFIIFTNIIDDAFDFTSHLFL